MKRTYSSGCGDDGSGSANSTALVIEGLDGGKVGLGAKGSVESIGLATSLGRESSSGILTLLANVLGGLVGLASVRESVTDELSDDVDVLG
jgi:hypothetical protein